MGTHRTTLQPPLLTVIIYNMVKKWVCAFLAVALCVAAFSQNAQQVPSQDAFGAGMDAFKSGDFVSAIFLLRKAVTFRENFNADTFYVLITAEMQAEDYKAAFKDCETFEKNFYKSPYSAYITYHKARCLFYQAQYEKCIMLMSDFCHDNPKDPMYASAVFWIAECFFVNYNYDDALLLYNRILGEYPDDQKARIAQYRVESITQSRREDKLLHLLKETGQEYLSLKEDYERQQKIATFENAEDARNMINELQQKVNVAQQEVSKLRKENNILKLMVKGDMEGASKLSTQGTYLDSNKSTQEVLNDLKKKAARTQAALDAQKKGE